MVRELVGANCGLQCNHFVNLATFSLVGQVAKDRGDGDLFALAPGDVSIPGVDESLRLGYDFQIDGIWQNPSAFLLDLTGGAIIDNRDVQCAQHYVLDGTSRIRLFWLDVGRKIIKTSVLTNTAAPGTAANWKNHKEDTIGAETILADSGSAVIRTMAVCGNLAGTDILLVYGVVNSATNGPTGSAFGIRFVRWNGTAWSTVDSVNGHIVPGAFYRNLTLDRDEDGRYHLGFRVSIEVLYTRSIADDLNLGTSWVNAEGTVDSPTSLNAQTDFDISPVSRVNAPNLGNNCLAVRVNNKTGSARKIVVAYSRDNATQGRTIFVAHFGIDDTPTEVVVLQGQDNPPPDDIYHAYASVQVDGMDNFYICYSHGPAADPPALNGGDRNVKVLKSTDDGATWAAHATIRDDAKENHEVSMPILRLAATDLVSSISYTNIDDAERYADTFSVEGIPITVGIAFARIEPSERSLPPEPSESSIRTEPSESSGKVEVGS